MASVATNTKTSKQSKPKTHPTYFEMIKDAILTLKERTGSSQYAIAKYIEEKQSRANTLPSNFKKILLIQLRNLVASGKLIKVKNSYKLSPDQKKPSPKPAAASKKPKAAVSKKAATSGKDKPMAKKTEKKVAKPKSTGSKGVKKLKSLKSPAKRVVAVKKAKK